MKVDQASMCFIVGSVRDLFDLMFSALVSARLGKIALENVIFVQPLGVMPPLDSSTQLLYPAGAIRALDSCPVFRFPW